jgi:hypothetical protein
VSIWHFPKGRLRPQYVTSNLKSIPCFDSNSSYIIIQHIRFASSLPLNMSVPPYQAMRVFFWVGSRSTEYERHFQETYTLLTEVQTKIKTGGGPLKLRFYIEFEYAETLAFLELFKRSGSLQDL